MKKLVILIIFITIGFVMNAQDSTKYVTDSNVEKLVDKYSGKIEATVVALSESLEQSVDHVYKILVRQQYVKAINGVGILLILLILGAMTYKLLTHEEAFDNAGDLEIRGFLGVISLGLTLLFLLIFFAGDFYTDITQGFINPEYGALQDIFELISKL